MATRCTSSQYFIIVFIGLFWSFSRIMSTESLSSFSEVESFQNSTNDLLTAERKNVKNQILLAKLTNLQSPEVVRKLYQDLNWCGGEQDFVDNLLFVQASFLAKIEHNTSVLVSKQFALCDFLFLYLMRVLLNLNRFTEEQQKRIIELTEQHWNMVDNNNYSTPLRTRLFSLVGGKPMYHEIDEWYSSLFYTGEVSANPSKATNIALWPKVKLDFMRKIRELQFDSQWILSFLADLQAIEIGIQSNKFNHSTLRDLNSILKQDDDGVVQVISLYNGKCLYNLIGKIEKTTLHWMRSLETLFNCELDATDINLLVSNYLTSLDEVYQDLMQFNRYLNTHEDSLSIHTALTNSWYKLMRLIDGI